VRIASDEVEMLTFRLANKQFAIDTTSIQEIIRMPRITHVPLSPEYVLGVANLRGNVIAVINGAIRLGHTQESDTLNTRVLVLSLGAYSLGFSVDEVRRIIQVPSDQIEPLPAEEGKTAGKLASGVIKLGGESVFRISPERLAEGEIRTFGGNLAATVKAIDAPVEVREPMRKVVVVQIGTEEFGIGIDLVSEVIRFVEPNPVPNAPAFLAGLITLRSHLVPVIDLRALMRRPSLREETFQRTTQLRAEYEKVRATVDRPQIAAGFLQNANRLLEMVGVHSESAVNLLKKSNQLHHEIRSAAAQAPSDSELRLRELAQQLTQIDHDAANDADRRILSIETETARFGVAVDRVTQVLDIPESRVQPPPAIVPQDHIQLEALAQLENPPRMILLVNLTEMITKNSAIRAHIQRTRDEDSTELMPTADQTSHEKWVSFVVGDEQFGLSIADVVEIGRLETIAHVPSAPKFIRGVINLRGNVIPVIDLRTRFEIPPTAATIKSRIIYIRSGAVMIGLMVERVLEIVSIVEMEPPPPAVCSPRVLEYLLGIAKHREQVILLLSSEKLTQTEQKRVADASKRSLSTKARPKGKS
jgi:purine-binding chemotaxis protein CheW